MSTASADHPASTDGAVSVDLAGPVATVEIHRPPHNWFDIAVMTDLAYHFGEAAAADPAKAAAYATRAGDLAFAASAPDDAVRWFALAREHRDGDDVDVELSPYDLTRGRITYRRQGRNA